MPLFATARVYVNCVPASTGFGAPVFVSDSVGALSTVVIAIAGAFATPVAERLTLAESTVRWHAATRTPRRMSPRWVIPQGDRPIRKLT